jgi:hypothetical protein
MAMPEATIMGVRKTKKPAAASFGESTGTRADYTLGPGNVDEDRDHRDLYGVEADQTVK